MSEASVPAQRGGGPSTVARRRRVADAGGAAPRGAARASLYLLALCLLSCSRFLAVLLTLSGVPQPAAVLEVTATHDGVSRTNTFAPTLRTLGFDVQAGMSGAILFTVKAKDSAGCVLAQGTQGLELGQGSLYNLELSLSAVGPCGAAVDPVDPTRARLSGLELSRGALSPAFAPTTLQYQVEIPSWISAVALVPTAGAGATINVAGAEVPSGRASAPIALGAGLTPVSIDVAAPGAATSRYAVNLSRDSAPSIYFKASNTGAGDRFGTSVALSGDTLAVGAYGEASGVAGAEGDDSAPAAGAVYVFVWDGTSWRQQAYLKASNPGAGDRFGEALSLQGDTLAVGARFEDSSARGVGGAQNNDGAQDSGAVYVFRRSASVWQQEAYIKASNAVAKDEFGGALSLSGERLAVGAIRRNGSTGGAYVLRRSGASWSEEKFLAGAADTLAGDGFGIGVSLDGERLAVGARYASSKASRAGAAYLFALAGSDWLQEATVTAPNARPAANDFTPVFGTRVALSGDTLAVSDPYEWGGAKGVDGDMTSTSLKESGAVYLFRRSGAAWTFEAYLKAANSALQLRFGAELALEGDRLLVGAPLESAAGDVFSGAAYAFRRAGGRWLQEAYLKTDGARAGDGLGTGVALSGGRMAVGAPGEDSAARGVGGDRQSESAADSGAVFFFP